MISFSKRVDWHKNHTYKHTRGLLFPEEFLGTVKPWHNKVLKGLQNCLGGVSKQKILPRRKYGNFHEEHFLIADLYYLYVSPCYFRFFPLALDLGCGRGHISKFLTKVGTCMYIYRNKLPLLHSKMEIVGTISRVEGVMSSISRVKKMIEKLWWPTLFFLSY